MSTAKTATLLTAALLAGAGGGAIVAGPAGGGGATTTTTTVVRNSPVAASVTTADAGTTRAAAIYRAAAPSVVSIKTGSGSGTGFVVASSGLIATNAHVVDGASSIQVTAADGRKRTATLVGKDGSTDVALLRISASGLKALQFANSSAAQVGDAVYAIGDPFGLDRTLTTGVVSALNRDITAPNGFAISGVLQTDAALNPGNSGGPLLDASGRVLGINAQIESSTSGDPTAQGSNTGIGFAVPADVVRRVVGVLQEGGTVRHGYLGVTSADATGGGAQVGQVSPGGPAADAGLQAGDVIVGVGARDVTDAAALGTAVDAAAPGSHVQLRIRRDGAQRTVTVTIGTRPAQASAG